MASSYPFPNNVHVSSSVTLKLNDSNYLLWKTQFESLQSSHKLIGFVNGAVSPPTKTRQFVQDGVSSEITNSQYESWFCTDQLVMPWLFGTLSKEVLGHVHSLTTAREIWLALAENFTKSNNAREFSLRRSLQLLSKKEKSLSTYCREFKSICDSLSSICKPVDESMKIFGFLNGLGREYDPIATVIHSSLSKVSPPTFNDIVSEVQGFDSKLQSYDDSSLFQPSQRGRGGRFGQNRGRGGYTTRGRGFSQHQSVSPSQGQRPICQICGRIGHTAIKCYNRFDNNYHTEVPTPAFASLQVSDDSGREWHPDSAATAHITSSTSGLQEAKAYEGTDAVMVGDGAYLPITHVGSTTISSAIGEQFLYMKFSYVLI
ncbi:PREDICTED: uncharacterized protein LOC104744006 [Camelina sativa]|uniref:Uncharacterized protein LOC104744006 n=1 Tax=Camelina sativa TaxID=90675 RepID=A0ABM0VYZ6_CAMSA|nr:PREDICTED: uncharacterized protein LOC104744006 [Camelina sativa]